MKTKMQLMYRAQICAAMLGLIAAGVILTTSCTKTVTGPAGAAGPAGTNGVANIVSYTVATTAASWTLSGSYWKCDMYTPEISQSVLDKGIVMVGVSGSSGWVELPFTASDVEFYYTYSLYNISYRVASASGSTAVPNPGAITYKYTVIPPGLKASGTGPKIVKSTL